MKISFKEIYDSKLSRLCCGPNKDIKNPEYLAMKKFVPIHRFIPLMWSYFGDKIYRDPVSGSKFIDVDVLLHKNHAEFVDPPSGKVQLKMLVKKLSLGSIKLIPIGLTDPGKNDAMPHFKKDDVVLITRLNFKKNEDGEIFDVNVDFRLIWSPQGLI